MSGASLCSSTNGRPGGSVVQCSAHIDYEFDSGSWQLLGERESA